MSDISSIALSGLNDAVRRVSVAASNIARASVANSGGDDASAAGQPSAPATTGSAGVQVAGLVPQGDDSETGSLVDMKQAEIGYKANLAVLKVDGDMQRDLLRDFKV